MDEKSKSPPENGQSGKSAFFYLKAHLRFWLIAIAGLTADLASKHWALTKLGNPQNSEPQPLVLIEDYLRFITVFNPGAVWGLFAGNKLFLVGISTFAIVVLLIFFATSRRGQWLLHSALGLILAGAMGNMHDRIFNDGFVVDFIEINLHVWPANPWPTFNIADALLCIGVGVLMVLMLFEKK